MAQHSGPGRVWDERKPTPTPAPVHNMDKRVRSKSRGLWAVFCILFVLVGVGIILYSTVFRLKRVQVLGTSYRTPKEVVAQAGIAEGDNILLLDEKLIREKINADRYLVFLDMQRDYPDGLILQVQERVPRVNIQSLGVQYTLDVEGMVLEQTQSLQLREGMIAVTGLDITSIASGRYMTLRKDTQLTAYKKVLAELVLQETISQISELNLSNVDNLYLVSVDGFTVRLGDVSDIQAKIGSMRTVLSYLHANNLSKGSIDVSDPVQPTYIPAG